MSTGITETATLNAIPDKAIEVENLTKYYGNLLAVDHISFRVRQGEVFGFLGPNGAGKTTTQRMLTTLLEPTEGRILINGHDMAHNAYFVKRQMGLVPEESNVYDELNAWDNLMFTARLYKVPRSERGVRAGNLLETFGLWEKRVVKVAEYSKGSCGGSTLDRLLSVPYVMTGESRPAGQTCCGQEERCDAPPCSADQSCWCGP